MEYFREEEKLLLMEGSLTVATLTEGLDCLRKYNLVINFLSNFARSTRYYNLDILTGKEIKLLNPLEEWKDIEDCILKKYNVKSTKEKQDKNLLINYMNEISSILYLDMRGNQINDFNDIVNENINLIRYIILCLCVYLEYRI